MPTQGKLPFCKTMSFIKPDKNEPKDKKSSERSRLTMKQKISLERFYQANPYPDQEARQRLCGELEMNPRKLQVWFQNRRSKSKTSTDEKMPLLMVDDEDINRSDSSGNTLLFLACASNDSSVSHLIKRGANVNSVNNEGMTPLYIAVFNGNKESVELLLGKKNNCNINIRDKKFGQTPLHIAALKGYEHILLLLLSKGQNVSVDATDFENRTSLHHASIYGHVRIARQLLNCRAQVNLLTIHGNSCLHAAVLSRKIDLVHILLDKGADVNLVDNYGFSALMFAVQVQSVEIVQQLLSRGAIVNQASVTGNTAIHLAAALPSIPILSLLAKYRGSLILRNGEGRTPYEVAVLARQEANVEFFNQQAKLINCLY